MLVDNREQNEKMTQKKPCYKKANYSSTVGLCHRLLKLRASGGPVIAKPVLTEEPMRFGLLASLPITRSTQHLRFEAIAGSNALDDPSTSVALNA